MQFDTFVYMEDEILIVYCTIILNIFIIVIIGCPILYCLIHYIMDNKEWM